MSTKKFISLEDESPFEDWASYEPYTYQVDKVQAYGKKFPKIPKFYASKEWLDLREQVLDHYGRKCMCCGVNRGIIQVDHVKPRYIYPELQLNFMNLQVLCKKCNKDKGLSETDYRPKLRS